MHRRKSEIRFCAQVASTQGSLGNPIAAAHTAQGIESAQQRNDAIAGARGGGAFADFQSLMDLIQTTVVPDTWEALGGPSTMAPYPAGIFVDSPRYDSSSVNRLPAMTRQPIFALCWLADPLRRRRSITQPRGGGQRIAMCLASPLAGSADPRKDHATAHQCRRCQPGDVAHGWSLASQIHFPFRVTTSFWPGRLAVLSRWMAGIAIKRTGLCTLRSDFFFTCIASAIANRAFGCTIDPTPAGA